MNKYTITIERTTRTRAEVEITAATAAEAIAQAKAERKALDYRNPKHDYSITNVDWGYTIERNVSTV